MGTEEKAFDLCYQKNYLAIYHFSFSRGYSRADAEEITAESFVRLWDRWPEMAGLDEISIRKWLYVTAGNIVKESRRRTVLTVPLEEVEGILTDHGGNEPIEEEQFCHYLREIERELSKSEWELFRSAFLEQHPNDAIMAQLEIGSTDVFYARIHRLRKKLKKMLPRIFGESEKEVSR